MLSFKEYRTAGSAEQLQESFKNLFQSDTTEKSKYARTVFDLIQRAYADQGGMHGSGFNSPEDMVRNIPLWKLSMKDGTVTGVALYKDKDGRKRVQIATDGSDHGKRAIGDVVKQDLKQARAHMEVSGKSLSFLKKQIQVVDHAQTYEQALKFHTANGDEISRPPADDPEVVRHPDLKDYFYQRKIGAHLHTKIMLGYLGKRIVEL